MSDERGSYSISGILYQIGQEQQITDTFKKRNIVIETLDPVYKDYITFELIQLNCDLVKDFKDGDRVKVFFNIKGREYQDKNTGEKKYFNSLRCWNIEKYSDSSEDIEDNNKSNSDMKYTDDIDIF
jgi:translation initiation factor IF-3